MLLHPSMQWKNNMESDLWPMAILYAAYIYNHTPKKCVPWRCFDNSPKPMVECGRDGAKLPRSTNGNEYSMKISLDTSSLNNPELRVKSNSL